MTLTFTPMMALLSDQVALFMSQASLIVMKQAHINVESNEGKNMSSGFCSFRWVFGFILLCIASAMHVCKFSFTLNEEV